MVIAVFNSPSDAPFSNMATGEAMGVAVNQGFLGFGTFLEIAKNANLGVVVVGGLLGGLLQPFVAKLNPKTADPTTENYLFSPLLGVAAAGISIYVLANSDTREPLRLLFFALVCGLAFPAILASAVDNMARRTSAVQQELAGIAKDSKSVGLKETVEAAQALRNVMSRNPADTIQPEGQSVIDTMAQQAVNNIAQTAAPTPVAERQIVGELQTVGATARSNGWTGTADLAAEQLVRLSETMDDRTAKAAAGQAAEQLASPPPT